MKYGQKIKTQRLAMLLLFIPLFRNSIFLQVFKIVRFCVILAIDGMIVIYRICHYFSEMLFFQVF
jgi:predicted aspartyl protease